MIYSDIKAFTVYKSEVLAQQKKSVVEPWFYNTGISNREVA